MRWPVLIVLLTVALAACEEPQRVPPDLAKIRQKEPLSTGYSPEIVYSDSAKIKARIRARYMYQEYDGKTDQVLTRAQTSVHMIFYNPQGEQQASLTCERAIMYERQSRMEALGDVVVTTSKGEIVETEKLVYLIDRQKVYTNTFVKITRPNEIILADSLESTDNMGGYRIYKIRGMITLQE